MKPLFIILGAFLASSCAENAPPAEEVRVHFERGISGEGKIVPLGNPEDPVPPPANASPTLQQ